MGSTSFPQFQPQLETVSEFLQRFTVQQAQDLENAGNDAIKKAGVLCRALPVNVITSIQRRIKPTLLSAATYDQIEEILKSQFEVKKSVVGAALKFVTRKQLQGESIETYAKILNDLASNCDYKDCCRDRLLRDIFVSGLRSSFIVSASLQDCDSKSFNECVNKAKLQEQLAQDAQDIRPFNTILTTNRVQSSSTSTNNNSASKVPSNYKCVRCGSVAKHFANKCFALNLKSHNCGKVGHTAKACKSKSNNSVHATANEGQQDDAMLKTLSRHVSNNQPQRAEPMTSSIDATRHNSDYCITPALQPSTQPDSDYFQVYDDSFLA